LSRFGVSSEIITQIISETDTQDVHDAALKLLEKKAKTFDKLPKNQAIQKAHQYLYSRGFDTNTRKAAIDEFWARE
jgi:SOS response regulatory protein OraA/RecX